MKTYLIKSTHDVYVDSYTQGEIENVNFYTNEKRITANNSKEAINKYFESTLYFSFEFNNEQMNEDYKNILHYSNLVDDDNFEATHEQIELWKEDKIKLYSNNTTLEIYELTEVSI